MKRKKFFKSALLDYLIEQESKPNRNSNFYKWFGDSKISKNGKPFTVFHGSSSDSIEKFDISKQGRNSGNYGHYGYGFYFSFDAKEAKHYGNNIYECYIKIVNPFLGNEKQIMELKNAGVSGIDNEDVLSIDYPSLKQEFKDNQRVLNFLIDYEVNSSHAWTELLKTRKEGESLDWFNDLSRIIEYSTLNKEAHGVPDHIIDDLSEINVHPKLNKGFYTFQMLHLVTDYGSNALEVTEAIKKLGYDGVIYGSEIVPFYANQIKSVKNNG